MYKIISAHISELDLLANVLSFLNTPEYIAHDPDAFLKAAKAEGSTGFLNVHGYLQNFENTKISPDQFGYWVHAVQQFGTLYTNIFYGIHPDYSQEMSLHETLFQLIKGCGFGDIHSRNGLNHEESNDDPRVFHAAVDILTRPSIREKLGEEVMSLITEFCRIELKDCYTVKDFNPKQFDATTPPELLDHPSYISLPSSEHSDKNHDHVHTGTLFENKGTFTIVCDGVSFCPDEDNIFKTTGKFAAKHVSESLKHFFEAELILKPNFNPSNPEDLKFLRSQFLMKIEKICKTFPDSHDLESYSLTTLEVSLVIPEGDHFQVVTLSIGDSQTMVVDPDGECIMMNAPENYVGIPGEAIAVLNPKCIGQPSHNCVRDMSNPNGYVGSEGFHNHDTKSVCSVSSLTVFSGSKVITGSDGFFDITCTPMVVYMDQHGCKRQLDFNDLPLFWALTNALIRCKLTDKELSDTLAALSVIFSSKADDVSVSVQTLGHVKDQLKS